MNMSALLRKSASSLILVALSLPASAGNRVEALNAESAPLSPPTAAIAPLLAPNLGLAAPAALPATVVPAAVAATATPATAAAMPATSAAKGPLVDFAQAEAEKLGSAKTVAGEQDGFTAAVARLKIDMMGPGFSIFDGGLLIDAKTIESIRAATAGHATFSNSYRDEWRSIQAVAAPFVDRITAALQAALPDEDILYNDAQYRVSEDDYNVLGAHVDGNYITVSIAFDGAGTVVYAANPEDVEEIRARTGELVVLTNSQRAWLKRSLGIKGTVHDSPQRTKVGPRKLLLIRYKISKRLTKDEFAAVDALASARTRAVMDRFKFQLQRRPGPHR
jgi:hypothetical protein